MRHCIPYLYMSGKESIVVGDFKFIHQMIIDQQSCCRLFMLLKLFSQVNKCL